MIDRKHERMSRSRHLSRNGQVRHSLGARVLRAFSILAAGLSVLVFAVSLGRLWMHEADLHRHEEPELPTSRASEVRGVVDSEILGVSDGLSVEGRWYLTDPRTHRIHILSRDGVRSRSFGGPGDGPGELTAPMHIAATSDRIWVADIREPRLTVYDFGGEYIEVIPLPTLNCVPGTVSELASIGEELIVVRSCLDPVQGVSYPIQRVDADRHIETLPISPLLLTGGPTMEPRYVVVALVVAGGTDRLYLADGLQQCVHTFDRSGDALRRHCFDGLMAASIPRSDRERLRAGIEEVSQGFSVDVPEHYPYFDRMAVREGTLWVRHPLDRNRAVWVDGRSEAADPSLAVPGDAFTTVSDDRLLVAIPRREGTEIRVREISGSDRGLPSPSSGGDTP